MFGNCFFIFKWPPPIISSQRFSEESRREQAEKVFDSADANEPLTILFFVGVVVRFDLVSAEQTRNASRREQSVNPT
jgi:hypothetical protein